MKTTIDISDALFVSAKREAQRRGTTFRDLVESALRQALESSARDQKSFRLRKHAFQGEGVQDGIQEGEWSRIRSMIYEGRGG
jgi:Arc/MetJ family transcription regulator